MLVCGKAIAGGMPCAVYGMSAALRARIEAMPANAEHGHSGLGTTLSANLLALAALEACLTEVMTDAAFAHMEAQAVRLEQGLLALLSKRSLPWHVQRIGARVELGFGAGAGAQRAGIRGRHGAGARAHAAPVPAQSRRAAHAIPQHDAALAPDRARQRSTGCSRTSTRRWTNWPGERRAIPASAACGNCAPDPRPVTSRAFSEADHAHPLLRTSKRNPHRPGGRRGRLGASPARPRRRDLRRPARPRGPGAGRVQSRCRRSLRQCRNAPQRICRARHRDGARTPGWHRQCQPRHWPRRDRRQLGRDTQSGRPAPVPARRAGERGSAAPLPLPRPAARAHELRGSVSATPSRARCAISSTRRASSISRRRC